MLLAAFLSCSDKSKNVTIEGNILGGENLKVTISEPRNGEVLPLDSTFCDEEGLFNFHLPANNVKFLFIHVEKENEPAVLLVEPGEVITFRGSAGQVSKNYQLAGSKGSELMRRLNFKLNETVTAIDTLSEHFRANREHEKFDSIKSSIDSVYSSLLANHKRFTINFVQENRYSLSAIVALQQQYDSKRTVMSIRDDFELFQLVDSSLYPLYPQNDFVKTFHDNVIREANQLLLHNKRNDMLQVDQPFPSLNFPMLSGGTVALNELKMRYILIDFWATWCSSCILNSNSFKSVYNDYHTKGFEIIQFALDDKEQEISAVVERNSLTWIHSSDFKAWNSDIIDTLRISSIPSNYLVDRHGTIKARNVGEKELRELLEILIP